AERPAAHELRGNARAVVVAETGTALELVARLAGRDHDRAADGVAPVYGALSALQHLDLLDVEELLRELRGIRHQHAVDQHGGRRLAVTRLRDAPNRDE